MHVDQGVDEEPASEVSGIAADLTAIEVEDAADGIVVEVRMDEAAERPEDENIVIREEAPLAEVDARLEVDGLEVAVQIVLVVAAIGVDALAVVAAEPIARASYPHRRGDVRPLAAQGLVVLRLRQEPPRRSAAPLGPRCGRTRSMSPSATCLAPR